MFERFFDFLAGILNFFYTLVPEPLRPTIGFGFAIIGLTVLVMAVITPLTVKSTRSMLQMQRLQPEMKRLQEKYKNDREKLNQELMAFYRENQINPLGGCLPMLAQMPVFIIMYQMMAGLTVRLGGVGSGAGSVIGTVQSGGTPTPWILTDQVFSPQHLNPSTQLYQAMSKTSDMNFLGMDLSLSASEMLRTSLVLAIPYFVLLAIILASGLYQNKQMQARNTSGNVNPQQQMIMKFMPFFMPIFAFGFPAGLALYWCTQNLCRIGTNAYITGSVYKKEHANDPIDTTAKEKSAGDSKGSKSSKAVTATATDKKSPPKKSAAKKSSPKDQGPSSGRGRARGGGLLGAGKKSESSPDEPQRSGPGKSAKSQAAHNKASGGSSAGGTTPKAGKNGTVNPRRSGESRRGSQSQKKR